METPLKASNPMSQPFVDGLLQGRIRFQRCAACGNAQHLSKLICRHCGSNDLHWHDANGDATVVAASTVWRAPSPEFRPLVPYVLVIAQLEEGPRLMAHAAAGTAVGASVRASFFEFGGRPLIRFLPS